MNTGSCFWEPALNIYSSNGKHIYSETSKTYFQYVKSKSVNSFFSVFKMIEKKSFVITITFQYNINTKTV